MMIHRYVLIGLFFFLLTANSFGMQAAKTKETRGDKVAIPEVFFTPTGKRYHSTEKCTFLARSKKIEKTTKAEAEKKSLTACGHCGDKAVTEKTASTKGASASKSSADEVFHTPNGKKYHQEDCAFISRSKKIEKISKTEAEKKGLEPCGVCMAAKTEQKKEPKKDEKSEEKKK